MKRTRGAPGGCLTGFTLIETLAALAIVGVGVFAILSIGVAGAHAVSAVHARERQIETADELMRIVTLWPRADLDRHLGDRREGEFILTIQLLTSDVYQLTVRDSSAIRALPLLVSSMYRRPTP